MLAQKDIFVYEDFLYIFVSNKEQYKKIEKYFGKETLSLANELIEFWGI